MKTDAIVELMECLLGFDSYTYYRDESKLFFRELTMYQFSKLYDIIYKYDLRFKIDNGLILWLD